MASEKLSLLAGVNLGLQIHLLIHDSVFSAFHVLGSALLTAEGAQHNCVHILLH